MQSKLIAFFPSSPDQTESTFTLLTPAPKPRTPTLTATTPPAPLNNQRSRQRKKDRLKVRRKPLNFSVKSMKRELESAEDAELLNKLVTGLKDTPQLQFNDTEYERQLLWSSFYSMLHLDKSSGALYFNAIQEHDQQRLYSKLAQLIDFYHFDQNMDFKSLKVDAMLTDKSGHNVTKSIYVDLVFKRPRALINEVSSVDTAASNQFKISSDNLLDLFTEGDEFLTSVRIAENSLANTTLLNVRAYFESKVNMKSSRAYFESKVNMKSSRSLMHVDMLKALRFVIRQLA